MIRVLLAACVLGTLLCAGGCGRSTEAHADPKTVRACLVRGGAKILPPVKHPANDRETRIAWEIDRSRDGNLISAIDIYFEKDAAHAVALAKTLHEMASVGTTDREASLASGRRAKVAWLTSIGHHPNARQRALLYRCIPR